MFNTRAQCKLWCSLEDEAAKIEFLQFGELPPCAFAVICGVSARLCANSDSLLTICRLAGTSGCAEAVWVL
jgi:hypothetical protein